MTEKITIESLAEEAVDAIYTVYCADSFDEDQLIADIADALRRNLAGAKRLQA